MPIIARSVFEKSLKMPQKYTKSVFKGWRGGRTTSVLICLLLRRSRRVDRHQNEVSTTSRSRDPFSMGDIWKLAPGRVRREKIFSRYLAEMHSMVHSNTLKKFGDGRTRNMVAAVWNRGFCQNFDKYDVMTSKRCDVFMGGNSTPGYNPCLVWVWRQLSQKHGCGSPNSKKKSKFKKSFPKYLENGWTDFQSGNRVGKVLMRTTSLPPVKILIRVEIKELRAKKGEKITFLSGHLEFATL